mmetsp:Transcript_42132/g.112388  ORF Transcript_42132/g.112388 Transcript_42132/m.112388 type:complete len:122 (+) Transcript_42132:112-477(+)
MIRARRRFSCSVTGGSAPPPRRGQVPRRTPTTWRGVHDASSRSHAVLRVYIYTDEVDVEGEGVLTLVDLAGSEHRIDSMHHTAQRRKEGAEINSSLMALKSVVHARANQTDAEHLYRRARP